MNPANPEQYIKALDPITSRVRTDVTAIKKDGCSVWTDEPMTKAGLVAHLFKGKPRGCCPIKAGESTTMLGLLDLDSHKGETSWPEMAAVAQTVMAQLRERGAAPIPFRSSGGKGVHIFVLFDAPQDAHSVRAFLRDALAAIGYKDGVGGVKNKRCEVFPRQDAVGVGRYGNQFILPLAGHSVPLDPETGEPLDLDAVLRLQWPVSPPVPFVEKASSAREASTVGLDLDMAGRALLAVPNDGSYEPLNDRGRYFKLLCAFKEAAGEDGYTVADGWSAQHVSFDQGRFDKDWDSIEIGRVDGAPANYLYHVAENFGFNEHTAGDFDNIDEQDMVEARQAIDKIIDGIGLVDEADNALASVKELLPAAQLSKDEHKALQERAADAVGVDHAQAHKLLPPPPRPRFASISFDEVISPKPKAWLIKHVVPFDNVAMLFGASGSGKSFIALDIAAAVVRGVPWRGFKTMQGEVAYFVAEGAGGFRMRVRAYIEHNGAEAGKALRAGLRIHEDGPNLLVKDDVDAFIKVLRAEGSPKLVIIDTLAQATPGANENSSEDMGLASNRCKVISQATGAMVMLIHHSGKDAAKGARGWSGLKGGVEVELEVSRSGDDRVVTVSKLKDGEDGAKFGFKLLGVPLGMDDDGEVYGSCVINSGPVPLKAPAKGKGKWQRRVEEALEDLNGLGGCLVPQAQVEERALEIAKENGEEPAEGKMLTNRINSLRTAIENLVEDGAISRKGTFIGRAGGEL